MSLPPIRVKVTLTHDFHPYLNRVEVDGIPLDCLSLSIDATGDLKSHLPPSLTICIPLAMVDVVQLPRGERLTAAAVEHDEHPI